MKKYYYDERYKNNVYISTDLCYYEQCERFLQENPIKRMNKRKEKQHGKKNEVHGW